MLLTRSPLRHTGGLPLQYASLDLHALGTPPAFVLSQDQTLHSWIPPAETGLGGGIKDGQSDRPPHDSVVKVL